MFLKQNNVSASVTYWLLNVESIELYRGKQLQKKWCRCPNTYGPGCTFDGRFHKNIVFVGYFQPSCCLEPLYPTIPSHHICIAVGLITQSEERPPVALLSRPGACHVKSANCEKFDSLVW